MPKLSLLMVVKNAEDLIEKTLASIQGLVDEIVVVDNASTDRSVEIVQKYGAKVFMDSGKDLGKLRMYGLQQVTHDWVLMLDSDEVVSKELKKEVESVLMLKRLNDYTSYEIPYQNHFLGRQVSHGGEDYKMIRLFRKDAIDISAAFLHEKIEVIEGQVGKLEGKIFHYSYRSLSQVFKKFTDYGLRDARQRRAKGEHTSLKKIFMYPLHMFWARFIKDKGYEDGLSRLPLDIGFAYMEFLTYFSMIFIAPKTIGIDGGDFVPRSIVNSGIKRLLDGFLGNLNLNTSQYLNYYYFSPNKTSIKSKTDFIWYHQLPAKLFATTFLPLSVIFNRNTIFLGFSGFIPLLLRLSKIKTIVFIYDFGFYKFPEYYANPSKMKTQTEQAITHADKIIVLSEYIRQELLSKYPYIRKQKVITIQSGVDHILKYESVRPQLLPKNYFLYVGVIKPMKNILRLIECFAEFKKRKKCDHKLILIGSKEEKYMNEIIESEAYKSIQSEIIFVEKVVDEELKYYYEHASALINLSFEEGFCYPVLEALVLGKDVIVNDLELYKEYLPQFKKLYITKNREGVIQHMIQYMQSSKKQPPTLPNTLTWNYFTSSLLNVTQTL